MASARMRGRLVQCLQGGLSFVVSFHPVHVPPPDWAPGPEPVVWCLVREHRGRPGQEGPAPVPPRA